MNRAACLTAAVVVLLLAHSMLAQPIAHQPEPATLRGESTQTRKRLAEAEQKLLNGKAADAADELQSILDESAEDLITIDGKQFQTARWVIHTLLAKLPPETLRAYQDRIDEPARKLLNQAKRDRDPKHLWFLLDRYFVSRPSDEALLLLGNLLFERGEFRSAENIWRRLLTDAGADIAYPGSKTDPALVRARIVLAVIYQNDKLRAKSEFETFKEKHASATGTLAGKTGPLLATLQTYFDSQPKLAVNVAGSNNWNTYGRVESRSGDVPGGLPPFPSQPTWQTSIPDADAINDIPDRNNLPPTTPPFGYPVIVNGEVFVSNGSQIFSFDLHTGKETRKAYIPRLFTFQQAAKQAGCTTLTAAGGLLYARLGSSVVRAPQAAAGAAAPPNSLILCLEPAADEDRLKELWRLVPPENVKVPTAWEGAPLVSGRRLWAVYAKFEGGRVVHVAVCYDPADSNTQPAAPSWKAELCEGALTESGERTRQELLTLAGRNLIFCSNNGAIAAVNAATGRRAWGFRYPRSHKAINNSSGDPAPAVVWGGRIFIAPADADRVYALDAETGRLLWESGLTEGARILGVTRNRLIITTTGPIRSVRGLSINTGSHLEGGGWIQGSIDAPLSYGHGFATENAIVWPSRSGLYFLDPRDGRPRGDPFLAPNLFRSKNHQHYFGHTAYASGVLVVVTPTQVWGYRAQSRKIDLLPDSPPVKRFDALIDQAEQELRDGDSARARALFAEAASAAYPQPLRAFAAARLLQIIPPADDYNQLPADVRDVLQAAILNEWILPANGIPVTLDLFVRQRCGQSPHPASLPPHAAKNEPCRHVVSKEAEIERVVKLPSAVAPLRYISGMEKPPRRVFASGPRTLVAVPIDGGATVEYTPADYFTHAADLSTGFVAAGQDAVAVYGAAREPIWVFRVPRSERLPDAEAGYRSRTDREASSPQLSSFTLIGDWLLMRIGESHLVALDLHAKRIVWILASSGRACYEPHLFPGGKGFGPHFARCGQFVVVQLSDGTRWFVELISGRPIPQPVLGDQTARNWWQHPPITLSETDTLVSDGPGLVRLLQPRGRVRWAFESRFESGLVGEPAQVRAWDDLLLVATRRNHGVEIERVKMSDGNPAWSRGPAFIDADRIDLHATDADADCVYLPCNNSLKAVKIATGKTAWETELPGCPSGWVVRAGKHCLLVYPSEAIASEATIDVWNRLTRSFRQAPALSRLPGLASTLYDAWSERTVPVLFLDAETGEEIARIAIPARGPAMTTYFDQNKAVIATGNRVVWIK